MVKFEELAPFIFTSGSPAQEDSHSYLTETMQGIDIQHNQINFQSSWVSVYGNSNITLYTRKTAPPSVQNEQLFFLLTPGTNVTASEPYFRVSMNQ